MTSALISFQSLNTRITLATTAIFLLGFWSLSFYASQMLRKDMEQRLGEQQFSTVSMAAIQIDRELESRFAALQSVAGASLQSMRRGPAAMQALIEQRPVLHTLFNGGIVAYGADGVMVADFPSFEGRSRVSATEVDVVAALKEGKSTIGRPVLGRASKSPLVGMSVPILDAKGEVIGALQGVINLGIPNFLGGFTENRYGKTGGYLIVAPQYRLVVTATDRSRVMETLPEPGANLLLDRFIGGYEGSSVMRNPFGVEILASDKGIPAAGWIMAAVIPTDEAFAPIRHMQQRMLIAMLFVTVLAGGLIWWMIRRQLAPALSTAQRLAEMPDMKQPLPVTRQDEIGDLIGGFNRLLATLSQREAQLLASETRFRKVFNDIPSVAIRCYAADGLIRYWNHASVAIYGYAAKEAIGRDVVELIVPPERRVEVRESLLKTFESGQPIPAGELSLLRKDGSQVDVFSSHVFVDLPGQAPEVFCVDVDLSERKHMEAELVSARTLAENANHAKSRFLAAASHDLRQPLSALSLYVGVLKTRVSADNDTLVANIQDCLDSLSDLLTDLLDVSKLDAGVVTVTRSSFSVDELLAKMLSVYAAEAELKGLMLRARSRGEIVYTDPALLRRILGNLVANAIRYTNKGGVLMACRRHQGTLWLEVWDTGIGIAPSETGIIFEEFRQLGDTSRNRGSGLGLAIVAKMASLLKLQVRLRSRPGHGSMFAIELPQGRVAAPALPMPAGHVGRALRIALVDDNEEVLRALVLALESSGHEVVSATSGKQLLDRLGDRAPDIVISDYRLVAMETGFDVIQAARNLFGHDLPALLITGDTDPVLIRSMADRGIAVHYKPLYFDALATFIEEATERRGA